jgi:AraC-like DNA-binding protein
VHVRLFAPSAALSPFVRRFEVVEADAAITRTLIPESGIILGFRYAGAATLLGDAPDGQRDRLLPNIVLTGLRTAVRHMHTAAHSGIIVAKFHPTGAASFVPGPLHEIFGEVHEIRDLTLPPKFADTDTTDAERITIVEQLLLSRYTHVAPDDLVEAAVREIACTHGAVRVAALAASLGVSQDTLEKRFRHRVGATPKQFATILRVRRAVELSAAGASFTTLAQEAGYYDQSHFNRDFRSITGTAPGQLLDSDEYC